MRVTAPEVRVGVFLKVNHFNLAARLLKLDTDAAIGRAIGMDRITISRARDGILGERFIAAVLYLFGEHVEELAALNVGVKFEDFFEIQPCKQDPA